MREGYYKERYWGLKASGLCVSCGKFPESEGLMCDACRERARLNSQRADKKRYARLRAEGLCTGCKRPVEDSKARCPECSRKNTDSVLTHRRDRIAQGLCATCGKPTRVGMTTCFECALKRSARRHAKAVTANSSTYRERRAKGLCGRCGVKPAIPGRTCCEECTIKRKRYTIAHADHLYAVQNERIHKRRANGLCVVCGAEAHGKRLCQTHAAQAREYHREYRRRANND